MTKFVYLIKPFLSFPRKRESDFSLRAKAQFVFKRYDSSLESEVQAILGYTLKVVAFNTTIFFLR